MKRFLCLTLIITMAIFTAGCNGGGGGGDSSGSGGGAAALNSSDVTLFFNFGGMLAANTGDQDIMLAKIVDFITMTKKAYAAPLSDYITSLYIKVTGDGMADIEYTQNDVDIAGDLPVTLTVPNGLDRTFYIELKDRNGFVLYSGSITIDVGDYQGNPQDIEIDVNLPEGISAEDYIGIGRGHLESHELEKAFIAFDTAIGMDADHPVANFFRGFVRFLLLIQKDDDLDVDLGSPNADIAGILDLYTGDDIYSSTIAPDIYNENYDTDLDGYFDGWTKPSGLATGDGADVIENVILPGIDDVISDLANAEDDPVFYTELTSPMHFDILSTIKVDRADVYILEAIAYALKAYLNHMRAYQLDTDIDYWYDGFNQDPYPGLQSLIDNDITGVGELDDASYLTTAKGAYSNGLDKLKAGLQLIDGRSPVNKEGHIFNLADDDFNIDKVTTNIDEVKAALDGSNNVTFYDDMKDDTAGAENVKLNLSTLFASPDRNNMPEIYYHAETDEDLPIFDTNNLESSADFVDAFTDVLEEVDGQAVTTLEDLLRLDFLPAPYKFDVPYKSIGAITGNLTDFAGVNPVMFSEEDDEKSANLDITDVYMAQDDTHLYIGIRFRDGTAPYTAPLGAGEFFNYDLRFGGRGTDNNNWNDIPVVLELQGYSNGAESWDWNLLSYGNHIGQLPDTNCVYAIGDMIVFKIPLAELVELINTYQHAPVGWEWNEEEMSVNFSIWHSVTGTHTGDWTVGCCLAKLKE